MTHSEDAVGGIVQGREVDDLVGGVEQGAKVINFNDSIEESHLHDLSLSVGVNDTLGVGMGERQRHALLRHLCVFNEYLRHFLFIRLRD